MDLGQIGPAETVEKSSDLEVWFVATGFLLGAGRERWFCWLVLLCREGLEEGLDLVVADQDLTLQGVIDLEGLSQREQVLGAIVASERSCDSPLGGEQPGANLVNE